MFGCRSIYKYRPETELSDQVSYTANQSSEEVEEELMEHGYVISRKGTTELMKLSKVVVHKFNDLYLQEQTTSSNMYYQ